MKILKKLKLHPYKVLSYGEMKDVRGGTESDERRDKPCDAEDNYGQCGGKCREGGEKGHCYFGQPVLNKTYTVPYSICYCELEKERKFQ